jgi:hypothetical protein
MAAFLGGSSRAYGANTVGRSVSVEEIFNFPKQWGRLMWSGTKAMIFRSPMKPGQELNAACKNQHRPGDMVILA